MRHTARQFPELISSQPSLPQLGKNPGTGSGVEILVVLIMDVDRRYYVPYWTSVTKLLESVDKPTPPRFGHLSGKSGGLIWIKPRFSEQSAPVIMEAPRGPEEGKRNLR